MYERRLRVPFIMNNSMWCCGYSRYVFHRITHDEDRITFSISILLYFDPISVQNLTFESRNCAYLNENVRERERTSKIGTVPTVSTSKIPRPCESADRDSPHFKYLHIRIECKVHGASSGCCTSGVRHSTFRSISRRFTIYKNAHLEYISYASIRARSNRSFRELETELSFHRISYAPRIPLDMFVNNIPQISFLHVLLLSLSPISPTNRTISSRNPPILECVNRRIHQSNYLRVFPLDLNCFTISSYIHFSSDFTSTLSILMLLSISLSLSP